MFKLTSEEKIASTIKSIESLIAAGWEEKEAIVNQKNLWNLCNRDQKKVEQYFELKKNLP